MLGRRRLLGCALLSAFVAAAALSRRPPLLDAATGLPAEGVRLVFPLGHALLAPLSLLGDLVACQSVRADLALLFGLLTFGFAFARFFFIETELSLWHSPVRGLRQFSAFLAALALLLAWGAMAPRPVAKLVAEDPDVLVVDFHSHTSASWDGRPSFTPERNMAWHERAGFNAAFVTDHNVFGGASRAHGLSRMERERGGRFTAFEGEELSLHDAHVIALGNRDAIDKAAYEDGLPGLERFLRAAGPKHGALAIMSLPEYARRHWDRLELLADWGAAGFELVATSPRGLDISRARVQEVAALCRRRNLLVTGATDNHGYGGSACVWNLVRLPGWRSLDVDALQAKLVDRLRTGGFSTVTVVERPRPDVPAGWTAWLHAGPAVFDALRRLPPLFSLFTLVWIWAPWLFWRSEGKIRTHR